MRSPILPALIAAAAGLTAAPACLASDVVLNEYNAVDSSSYLGSVDSGGSSASDVFWGRRMGNGGDWFEIVVITDMLDMRGWEFVVVNEAGDPLDEESWSLTLTNHDVWAALRSGTVVTISQNLGNNADDYLPMIDQWWLNVRADPSTSGTFVTVACIAPACPAPDANWKVSNKNWQLTVKDSFGATVFGPAGEGIAPASGVGSLEVFKLEQDPSATVTPASSSYNDGTSSTFGQPNVFAGGTLQQDFAALRSVVPYTPLTSVVINEVLSHSDAGEDWVELHNTTGADVDISGWFLSDSFASLSDYVFPPGTIVEAGGYLVVTETQSGFALSAHCGDEIILSAGDGVSPTGPRDFLILGALDNGVAFGRPLDDPSAVPARLADATQGAGNAGVARHDVVINEIMYHPPTPALGITVSPEFIELRNTSATSVDLFVDYGVDGIHPWRITGGVTFDFDTTQTIAAGGFLLVVGFDPVAAPALASEFRGIYSLDPSVPMVGPYAGALSNSTETVRLRMPDTPESNGDICGGIGNPSPFVPYVVVEEVTYADSGRWPTQADGLGASLERISASAQADDAANWVANVALSATPGAANSTFGPPSGEQQECLNSLNKNLSKVAKTQNKEVFGCFKDAAKGKLGALSVDDCFSADRKGKVAKVSAKTLADESESCAGTDSLGGPKRSFVGARDGGVVVDAGVTVGVAAITELFGYDADSAVVPAADDKAASKCQVAVAKDLKRCIDAELKEFVTCKKIGLKRQSFSEGRDLEVCVGTDAKGKVAKACDTKLASGLIKRCVNPGVDLASAFPGCATASPALLRECLAATAACRVCLALDSVDDLYADCDIVDDGVDDDSCP